MRLDDAARAQGVGPVTGPADLVVEGLTETDGAELREVLAADRLERWSSPRSSPRLGCPDPEEAAMSSDVPSSRYRAAWEQRGRPQCTHEDRAREVMKGQSSDDWVCFGCGVGWPRGSPTPPPEGGEAEGQ